MHLPSAQGSALWKLYEVRERGRRPTWMALSVWAAPGREGRIRIVTWRGRIFRPSTAQAKGWRQALLWACSEVTGQRKRTVGRSRV